MKRDDPETGVPMNDNGYEYHQVEDEKHLRIVSELDRDDYQAAVVKPESCQSLSGQTRQP